MKFNLIILIFCLPFVAINAQDEVMKTEELSEVKPYYYQIPDYPESYSAATVAARMVDGLGFRYFWATEGLRPDDLAYTPGNNGSNAKEVIVHIYGLALCVKNAALGLPNTQNSSDTEKMTFEELREGTLESLKKASEVLKRIENGEVEDCKVIFQRGDKKSEYPFWNLLNGMLSDAIYHTGQIVSYRRSAGNPVNSKVSVFRGKLRE